MTGQPVEVQLPFLGRRILEATLATLRRSDGDAGSVPALVYQGPEVLDPEPIELPDLDEAESIVVAGGSAGGAGVINNLDFIADTLRATNTRCTVPGTCPLETTGITDSAFPPQLQYLDLTYTPACLSGAYCSWDAQLAHSQASGTHSMWGASGDGSCVIWAAAHAPAPGHRCRDEGFVLNNHVTSPIFVRMGQVDELLYTIYRELDVRIPGGATFTPATFAQAVRLQGEALAGLLDTANEKADLTIAPGTFMPTCIDHDTLRQNTQVYDVKITQGGSKVKMMKAFKAWQRGRPKGQQVSGDASESICQDTPP
jgi:hypothetical protein